MKILFVISTLKAGGAERVCALLASKFSQFHDVALLKFDESKPFYELDEHVRLLNLAYGTDELGIFGNFKKRLGKIFAIRKIIKNEKFDAVISFLDSTNILVLLSSFALKTPVVISEHTSFDANIASKVYKILKRIFYPSASGVSVLTKIDAAHYSRFCKNVAVVHNPLAFKSCQAECKKENLVIFVGRLVAPKNCEMFIKVAAKLKNSGYKFVVAGDGELKAHLQNLAQKLGANVEFLGNVVKIDELYEKAKILLSTSVVEGFGNVLIEAMAYDVARISTPTNGANELISDGFDGFLTSDINQMSGFVMQLIQDESKRAQICLNARIRLDEFRLENIYERWLILLKTAGVDVGEL